MDKNRKTFILAAILAAIAVAWYRMEVFSDQASGPKPNVVVVTGGSGQFWQLIGKGAEAAAKDINVKLDVRMPEGDEDLHGQTQLLSGINLDEVDGVAISPLDPISQSSLINRMINKAFVVTMDSDAPQSARHSYVGTSNIAAGRSCAMTVKEALPEGGTIAVLIANNTKQNIIERKQGFEENLALTSDLSYEIVDFLIDDGDNEKGKENIKSVLEKHPDLACFVGMNGYHGPLLLEILKNENKLDSIKIVAFDEFDETLAGVEAGHIFATIIQDPFQYGYQSVKMLSEMHRATEAQRPLPGTKSTLAINTRVIRKDDVVDFRMNLKSRLGKTE